MFAFYGAEFDTFGSPLVQRETSLNSRLRTCQKTPELDKKKLGLCMYAAHLWHHVDSLAIRIQLPKHVGQPLAEVGRIPT